MKKRQSTKSKDLIKAVNNAIDILFSASFWAKEQTNESLIESLREEINEFATSLKLGDKTNIHLEAADIIMLLLFSIRFRFPDIQEDIVSSVLGSLEKKLLNRFSHLYRIDDQLSLFNFENIELPKTQNLFKGEDAIWQKSKRSETLGYFAFCPNEFCVDFSKVNKKNMILLSSGSLLCSSCNQTYKLSKCTLFSKFRTDKNIIIESIVYLIKIIDITADFNASNIPHNIKSWIYSALPHEEALAQIISSRFGIPSSRTKKFILKLLREDSFKTYQILEKNADWHARSWDNQKARRYILKNHRGLFLESMTLFHYRKNKLRDVTIEISNMHGCNLSCAFCASRDVKGFKRLEPHDFILQVISCLSNENLEAGSISNFFVSFAGIGEPSYSAENVSIGAQFIQRLYPHVRFNIATTGIKPRAFDLWLKYKLPLRRIQIPFLHYDKEILFKMTPEFTEIDFLKVLDKAVSCAHEMDDCKVKINFIMIEKFNDAKDVTRRLAEIASKHKSTISIKLSILNPTNSTIKLNLRSPPIKKIEKLRDFLIDKGFEAYIFGTEFDCFLGCGQLIGSKLSDEEK